MPRSLLTRPAFAVARELRKLFRQIMGWVRFWSRYSGYRRAAPRDRRPETKWMIPCLLDDLSETPVDATYFFQDAWAFQKIFSARPEHHVDVGSHHKFVSLLSQVVPTTMVDIRPLPVELPTLDFQIGSILDLPFSAGSLASVSSICVVEHIGLGRYGDPLDPFGTEKAIEELKRVIAPQGDLYISLPIDDEDRTYFDAHRAFAEPSIIEMIAPFQIIERRYIYGRSFTNDIQTGFGTACYHLRRPS